MDLREAIEDLIESFDTEAVRCDIAAGRYESNSGAPDLHNRAAAAAFRLAATWTRAAALGGEAPSSPDLAKAIEEFRRRAVICRGSARRPLHERAPELKAADTARAEAYEGAIDFLTASLPSQKDAA